MKLAGAYINDDTYERLVALALSHNRTLAGQCRHLFDRALKGDLQVPDAPRAAVKPVLGAATVKSALREVPDAQTAKPGTPVAAKPAARALDAQPLAGALPRPRPGATAESKSQPVARAALRPQPGSALRAQASLTVPACENVPVAGMGVEVVMPVGTGSSAMPTSPATGLSRPACCAGEDAGCHGAAMISNHTPTMMKTHTLNAPRRGRCRPGAAPAHGTPCLHDNPALKSAHAARGAAR
jgi:hypothetical protein